VDSLLRKALGTLAMEGPSSLVEALSDRELEVFEHIGNGKDTNDIAASMGVSPKTVETHRMHIKEKLRISSLSDLIRHAAVWADHKNSGNP
jgi:DNA-binding CsgD family transcriptional regulator